MARTDGLGVGADGRSPRQNLRRFTALRMAPGRRDLGQRPHHEQAFSRAGMGNDQTGFVEAGAAMGDQVKIQGAVGVRAVPAAAKGALERLKPAQ